LEEKITRTVIMLSNLGEKTNMEDSTPAVPF